jgi:hypothetical protein
MVRFQLGQAFIVRAILDHWLKNSRRQRSLLHQICRCGESLPVLSSAWRYGFHPPQRLSNGPATAMPPLALAGFFVALAKQAAQCGV